MKKITVKLMFRDRKFDTDVKTGYGKPILRADLELSHILSAMSRGDNVIYDVCSAALLNPLQTFEEIEYRQINLKDARDNSTAVKRLYDIILDLYKQQIIGWRAFSKMSATTVYEQTFNILNKYLDTLLQIRSTVENDCSSFKSEGFKHLYATLQQELNEDFFSEARREISILPDIDELLLSASLNDTLCGVNYKLRKKKKNTAWLQWKFSPVYNSDLDDNAVRVGISDWDRRRERALKNMAYVLSQTVRYVETFFEMLRRELAFYIGCLNLEETMRDIGMPVCTPRLRQTACFNRTYRSLYDISLALIKKAKVTGNDINTSNIKLYVVTGVNQGGKTTFLRSIGQAQLMAQCGMPVGAEYAEVPLRGAVFTHFKREEDSGMRSGKLDEELQRMREIVEYMQPHSIVLLNESFASTNEREGSELCRQITRALTKNEIEVFSVTHLYDYASSFTGADNTVFLRAQRLENGSRTYLLEQGEPLETAYGEELYSKIFE